MIILIVLTVLVTLVFVLNNYLRRLLGLDKTSLDISFNDQFWIAETSWFDKTTGQESRIITKSDRHDGIISILNGEETIYHTKQPFHHPHRFKRFHLAARSHFFKQLMVNFLSHKLIFYKRTASH